MSLLANDPCPPLSTTMSPRTPPSPARNALPTPPDSIQKYSDALRRAMTARFEQVAQAGLNAKAPLDAATDVEYGFDENPFDTHARLLSSLSYSPSSSTQPLEISTASSSSSSHSHSLSHAHAHAHSHSHSHHSLRPPRRPKRVLDLDNDVVLDSPLPSPRRRASISTPRPGSSLSRNSSLSCSTPSSETSFEVGRSSDYLGLYGKRPTPRTPPACSPSDRRNSLLGSSLRPLTALTPSPQPQKRSKRRSKSFDEADGGWDEHVLARTDSETMLLAAGLASQRGRRSGAREARF